MPGVGGLSIANNLLSNNIQLNLNKNQASLMNTTAQLSSGLRINGPGDDPSGFSIATNLQTQVNSIAKRTRC
jgi:flagellin